MNLLDHLQSINENKICPTLFVRWTFYVIVKLIRNNKLMGFYPNSPKSKSRFTKIFAFYYLTDVLLNKFI